MVRVLPADEGGDGGVATLRAGTATPKPDGETGRPERRHGRHQEGSLHLTRQGELPSSVHCAPSSPHPLRRQLPLGLIFAQAATPRGTYLRTQHVSVERGAHSQAPTRTEATRNPPRPAHCASCAWQKSKYSAGRRRPLPAHTQHTHAHTHTPAHAPRAHSAYTHAGARSPHAHSHTHTHTNTHRRLLPVRTYPAPGTVHIPSTVHLPPETGPGGGVLWWGLPCTVTLQIIDTGHHHHSACHSHSPEVPAAHPPGSMPGPGPGSRVRRASGRIPGQLRAPAHQWPCLPDCWGRAELGPAAPARRDGPSWAAGCRLSTPAHGAQAQRGAEQHEPRRSPHSGIPLTTVLRVSAPHWLAAGQHL